MEKFNVVCSYCGKKDYNPNIPENHVINCCSSIKCREEASDGVVGFKNGNIQDNRFDNLYVVKQNHVVMRDYQLPIKDYDLANKFALVKYYISQNDYKVAVKLLRANKIENSPEGIYLMSQIHFKAHNNPSLGVKCLKNSSKLGFPIAMAEYGYILTMKKYGQPLQPETGMDLLLKAYEMGVIEAADYLVDVYINGPAKSKTYQSVSKTEWFEYAKKAAIEIQSYDSWFLLGYFYKNGLGINKDLLKAYEWLKLSSDQDSVLACAEIVELIIYNRDNPFFSSKLEEAKDLTKFYLDKAKDKTNEQYESMKYIYNVVLPDLEK